MKIQDLHNKKIAILWFGLEWQSSLKFLQEQGIEDITVLDKNEISQLSLEFSPFSRERGSNEIQVITWEIYLDSLSDFDIIIKSPGVSPFGEKLLPHREKFISQTQIFFENYTWKVVGITGTKGKSTISTLLYTCLQKAWYSVKLVGNIGSPVLHEIDVLWEATYDYIVYEMSSYMLQDFTPKLHIWFLNNIYPCHLDWHYDSMNIYKEAKLNILRNAESKIINSELQDDIEIMGIDWKKIFFNQAGKYEYHDESIYYEESKIFHISEIRLEGEHNMKNICGAASILGDIFQDTSKTLEILKQVLPNFSGLPHRIENIWIYEGITFINDAIATTPESTIAAIDTFGSDLQTLFIWGEDSGFDFKKIRQKILDSNIQNIIAFPDTAEKIFPEIKKRDYENAFEIEISGKLLQFIKTRSMKQGVDFTYKTTLPWKIALLSCAAPSFSLWTNYKEKAAEFIREVQEY